MNKSTFSLMQIFAFVVVLKHAREVPLLATYRAITKGELWCSSHYSECPEYPLACPNKCGVTGISPPRVDDNSRYVVAPLLMLHLRTPTNAALTLRFPTNAALCHETYIYRTKHNHSLRWEVGSTHFECSWKSTTLSTKLLLLSTSHWQTLEK